VTDEGLREEGGRLAVAPQPPRRPWYRELGSLLAVIALVFSFGTTAVSYVRTAQLDAHDRRVELTDLVQRINAITRDAVDVQVTYAANPPALAALARTMTQERLLIAKQAERVMGQIPDQVGAAEYALVAAVLIAANIDSLGLPLLDKAVKASRDANDLTGSLRTWGNRLFAIGQADLGRAKFGEALLVFDKEGFRSDDQAYVASTQLDTQFFWAAAELQYGTCDSAKQHLAEARALVPKIPVDDPRIAQLATLEPQIATCTPRPAPTPGIVP
jgi:hypothetical protein